VIISGINGNVIMSGRLIKGDYFSPLRSHAVVIEIGEISSGLTSTSRLS